MELTFQWFWLVKATLLILTLYVAYKAAWVNRMGSKVWNILFLVLVVFAMMSPVKMNPTTNQVNSMSNLQIEQQHRELPPMIRDNSFRESTNVKQITPEELK